MSRHKMNAKCGLFAISMVAVSLVVSGCIEDTIGPDVEASVAPVLTESRDEVPIPTRTKPQMLAGATRTMASSKLHAADGMKVEGHVEFFERGREVVVVGTCEEMDPAQEYYLLLHEQSSMTGDCSSGFAPIKIGPWRVSRTTHVGQLKVEVQASRLWPLQQFSSASVQMVNETDDGMVVQACGSVKHFK